ncbi:MAG: 23S rRNA (adenine(2503)-C(2))-methyltransferase RlmN [Chloroflexota bacterium]|nr:23S rRNA (adenine(2503)-C(2))-methyltransferase RlmN [Chloroflexota bacterium]
MKNNFLDLTYSQLQTLLDSWGEPAFRAEQTWSWVYKQLADDYDEMRNVPKALRQRLADELALHTLTPLGELTSADRKTRKVLFRLGDGQTIETVLMHYRRRHTVCISTQVGCPIGCSFCATGQSGFERDLSSGEIVAQALYFARQLRSEDKHLSNVVIMGMGEPLLNYDATWQAIETLTDERGFNLGARRITLSTAGVIPGIRRLSREKLQVGLAISLHAPTEELRSQLVPLNRRYPLRKLIPACQAYVKATGRRVTFEYALIHEVNDWKAQARKLASLLDGLLYHVNLIPLNPTADSTYKPSSSWRARVFQEELNRLHVPNTLRLGRGVDIQAGCGQLRLHRK